MPSPNPTTRRHYKGNAVPTTLSAPIVSSADTSFMITANTGWPDGSVGNFVVTINAGQSDEEKVLCSTRSGSTVNVATRGFDSTAAAGHAAGATVTHTISAFDADEWNAHTNATTGVHGHTGAAVGTTDAQVLTNKTLTAPVIASISNTGTVTLPTATTTLVGRDTTDTLTNKTLTSPTVNTPAVTGGTVTGTALDATSTVGGVSGTSLAADRTAWTTYTPTFTNITSAAGTFAYKQIGKTLLIRAVFTAGTTTGLGPSLSLPNSLSAVSGNGPVGYDPVVGHVWNASTTNFSALATVGTSMSGAGFNAVLEVA